MRRGLRRVLTAIVLVGLVVAGVQVSRQRAQNADDSERSLIQDEAVAAIGNLAVSVSATGTISPLRQVALAFELNAPVSEVLVSEGQAVKADEVLARLDTRDLEVELLNAQISLDSQLAAFAALNAPPREVDVAVAQAALSAAQAQSGTVSTGPDSNQIEIARLQVELAKNRLWQAQLTFASESELERLEYDVQIAETNYAAVLNQGPDTAALSSANAQIVAARAQLERLLNGPSALDLQIADVQLQSAQLSLERARADLSRAVLRAPFDGVVARQNLVVGELPPSGAALLLIDPSGYFVDVAVDETDIAAVQLGQTVRFTLDALPQAGITGKVTRIAAAPVRVGQLVTYAVRITLDPTEAPVRVGMTATATIVVSEVRDVLTLPNRFIRIDRAAQRAFVTRERPGGFEETEVTLGLRNETISQITGGLEEGERVVLLPRETFNPIPGAQP